MPVDGGQSVQIGRMPSPAEAAEELAAAEAAAATVGVTQAPRSKIVR